jgi:hypothetical protein
MYGDTEIMRRRADQLRQQGVDVRTLADQLVARTESIGWTGRAAESMRERIRDRASQLRDAAGRHDFAADSLDKHLGEVERLQDLIAVTQRKVEALAGDARTRVAAVASHDTEDRAAGISRLSDPSDQELATFEPPPDGHRDWLSVTVPGL